MKSDHDLEVFAVIVHSLLALLHALAFVFNVRRRNRVETIAHGAAAVWETVGVVRHVRAAGGAS